MCSKLTKQGTITARLRGQLEIGAVEKISFYWIRQRGIISSVELAVALVVWRFLLLFIHYLRRPPLPWPPTILPTTLLPLRRRVQTHLLQLSSVSFSHFASDLPGSSFYLCVSRFWINLLLLFFFFVSWYFKNRLIRGINFIPKGYWEWDQLISEQSSYISIPIVSFFFNLFIIMVYFILIMVNCDVIWQVLLFILILWFTCDLWSHM